jgi:hypothetical protein
MQGWLVPRHIVQMEINYLKRGLIFALAAQNADLYVGGQCKDQCKDTDTMIGKHHPQHLQVSIIDR